MESTEQPMEHRAPHIKERILFSEKDEPSIGDGSAAIIVYDKGLENNPEHDFYKWLIKEGFSFWSYSKGFYDHVCWAYVNINSKLFTRGVPGINVASHLGDHAVTIDEFKTIYSIFCKYDGLPPLQFERLAYVSRPA